MALAALQPVLAWGLWNLKNWARILVIVVDCLAMLGYLCGVVTGLGRYGSDSTGALVLGGALSVAIGGYILYWFWTNGALFD